MTSTAPPSRPEPKWLRKVRLATVRHLVYRHRAKIEKQRFGTPYGGWVVPVQRLNQDSVCFSFGAGEDISFDVQLAAKVGARVEIFDPTPRAKSHFSALQCYLLERGKFPFPERLLESYNVPAETLSKLHFHPMGVWNEDTTVRFYAPRDSSAVSHSIVNLQQTSEYFEAQVFRLKTLMQRLGVAVLDFVKFDIEGAEYKVIDSMLNERLPVKAFGVEFDEYYNRLDNQYLDRIRQTIDNALRSGYEILDFDRHFNITFVRS